MVGKVISTQIPTSLPMKPMMTTSLTTTSALNVEVDLSKFQQKKGYVLGKEDQVRQLPNLLQLLILKTKGRVSMSNPR